MARTNLDPTTPAATGTVYTFDAANADGEALLPGSTLLVRNDNASALTVTLITGGTVEGLAVDDPTVTVAASTEQAILIPTAAVYRQTSGSTAGRVHVDYSDVTSVTRACLQA